ncbi:hypothetical protein TRIUR3_26740 [Triticum urartu]|uniref:RNase H type-1 domain-containing protein n=1 Tax=Triticum urartu TaxID=4572 RepID=M8AW23_TRIUA|nr:hypothetical protein TRIUR3_26740 [Triticum urartu]
MGVDRKHPCIPNQICEGVVCPEEGEEADGNAAGQSGDTNQATGGASTPASMNEYLTTRLCISKEFDQSLDFLAGMQLEKLKTTKISCDVLTHGLWCHGMNQLCQEDQATIGRVGKGTQWAKPPQGPLKINRDAAYDGETRATAGIVIRDSSGCVILAQGCNLPRCSNIEEAEARMCAAGLRLGPACSDVQISIEN